MPKLATKCKLAMGFSDKGSNLGSSTYWNWAIFTIKYNKIIFFS